MINHLASASGLLQAQAAWALGNIAADGVQLRDLLLSQGAAAALLALVDVRRWILVVDKMLAFYTIPSPL